ncbi:MAG: NADH-quinone oxidoreductase subunit K, partial [Parvularculaceae bacterium]
MIDFTFIIERYNYWIFIVLMMMGLYIVIARGNLVKKIVGLNIFQTSVFIYYISIGKIAGGTAPIIIGEDAHGAPHTQPGEAPPPLDGAAAPEETPQSLHATPQEAPGAEGQTLEEALRATPPAPNTSVEGLHATPLELPEPRETNVLTAPNADAFVRTPPATGDEIALAPPETHDPQFVISPPGTGEDAAAADLIHQAAEII